MQGRGASGRPTGSTTRRFPKEDADAWHVRAFGEHADYACRPRRVGEGGTDAAPARALRLAAVEPLIDGAEQIGAPVTPSEDLRHHRDPLPTGTTLLEASAGTGKTWTIAALVTKHVAEGDVRLEEMLVVTFTRAASQELRERVRAQLDEAVQVLRDPADREPGNRLHRTCCSTPTTSRAGGAGG